jgi:type IV secretion system protein VirD4
LLCLDEATRVEIPELPELVSTVAGRNMSAMIYVQSLSQLEGVYGKSGASTIRDNCHTQIFYGPQDLDTAKYISEALGKYSYLDWTVSRTESFEIDSISQSEGQSVKFNHRELLTPDELLRMNPEYTITFTRSKPPIVGRRLEPWRLPQGYTAVPAPELKELPKVGVFELPQVKREYKELPDLREL